MKNNLKAIRERLGLTQAEFAIAMGVSQGNISHCELQRQEVSPDLARRVIDAAERKGIAITFDDIYLRGTEKAA